MYGKNQSSVGGDVQSDSVPGSSGGTDSSSVILARLDYIFTELRDLKADRAEVVSSVNACKNDIVTAISAIDERIKKCNDDNRQLKKANMKLQKELGEVKLQINELIQSTQYNSSVRINNVPYTEQENVIILRISMKLTQIRRAWSRMKEDTRGSACDHGSLKFAEPWSRMKEDTIGSAWGHYGSLKFAVYSYE
uniref:Uncharacterized protein n=1 Tax=Rhodnius prolixus TaxID=13249 RepID=T1I9F5_RHOPR